MHVQIKFRGESGSLFSSNADRIRCTFRLYDKCRQQILLFSGIVYWTKVLQAVGLLGLLHVNAVVNTLMNLIEESGLSFTIWSSDVAEFLS